jgi:hypothetical protein
LGYNTTNGQVVYSGTNPLTFTNPLAFGDTTNTASIRTNLGLGATNYPVFRGLEITTDGDTLYINPYNINADTFGLVLNFEERNFSQDGATVFQWSTNSFTVTPNATLNGVNSTAPSQTADSASSLMTRALSDDRYGAWENTFEISNFTGLTAGVVSGGATTITPGYTTLRVVSGGSYRSMFSYYRASLTGASASIQSGSRSTRAVVGNEIESRVYSAFYPVLGAVSSQWAGRGVGVATTAGVLPYFLYYDSAWRAIKATFVRGSASVYPVRASDVITIESNGAHNLTTNDFVSVAGVFPQSMQTWRAAVLSTPTANSFTYANVGADETGTTILGDNMNISKIEELGTNAVTVVANQFSGVVTRDFRVDVSADGTADFYINGSNIATGTGFWVTGGNNTARMGFGLESQTDATTVSDIYIYKASHTINP